MQKIIFEWDDQKNQRNIQKHGVSFEEAETIFFDTNAAQIWDGEHSYDEDRFLMLGMSSKARILLVVHCFRESESTVRLISARKAKKSESKEYTGGIL